MTTRGSRKEPSRQQRRLQQQQQRASPRRPEGMRSAPESENAPVPAFSKAFARTIAGKNFTNRKQITA